MIHDGEGNPCRKTEGNIMSPTLAGNNGIFFWSTCSRQYLSRFLGYPAFSYTLLIFPVSCGHSLVSETLCVICYVLQNSPGILSGGWTEADWSVQVPRTTSRTAVWCRHAVQVAVWLQGRTLQPWVCQGEILILPILVCFHCNPQFYNRNGAHESQRIIIWICSLL